MAVVLALGAGVLWGLGDFLGGLASRRLPTGLVLLAGQLVGLLTFLVVVARPGLTSTLLHLPDSTLAVAAGAGVTWLGGLACFYRGCVVGSMAVVAPLAAAGVVVPVLLGLADGGSPGALRLGGIVAAVAGVVLCSTSATSGPDTVRGPAARRAGRAAASYGLGAALCFGIELALLNRLSAAASPDASMLVVRGAALAVLVVALAVPVVRRRRAHLLSRGRPPLTRGLALVVLAVGVTDVAAMALFVRSGEMGSLPVVAVLASLYPAVTVALGRVVEGDPVRRAQRLGLAAVLVGASLVAVP